MKPTPTLTPLPLPDAVTRYFDATNRFDAASAAESFTPQATVLDDGKTYVGTEAIRNWISQTCAEYQANTTVMDAQRKGAEIEVSARVSGKFPGSPVELRFVFALSQEKIARLSIQ